MVTNKDIQKDSCTMCSMKSESGYCPKPLEESSKFLGKKWAISIIITVGNFKKLRFNQLLEKIKKATPKIISERLKDLESEKIIKRKVYNEIPPRVEYSLTSQGKKLMNSLLPLVNWAERG